MTRQENRKGADWLGEQMEQGRADEADAGQVWRGKQAGEEYRNTGGTHRANRQPKPRKHNETRQDCDRTMTICVSGFTTHSIIFNHSQSIPSQSVDFLLLNVLTKSIISSVPFINMDCLFTLTVLLSTSSLLLSLIISLS